MTVTRITVADLREMVQSELGVLAEADASGRVWVKGHWQAKGKPSKKDPVGSKLDELVDDVVKKIDKTTDDGLSGSEKSSMERKLKKHVRNAIKIFHHVHILKRDPAELGELGAAVAVANVD